MRVQLLHPVSRFKQVQSLQHTCRFVILKMVRRDLIPTLPLPRRLIDYLSTPHYYSEQLAAEQDDRAESPVSSSTGELEKICFTPQGLSWGTAVWLSSPPLRSLCKETLAPNVVPSGVNANSIRSLCVIEFSRTCRNLHCRLIQFLPTRKSFVDRSIKFRLTQNIVCRYINVLLARVNSLRGSIDFSLTCQGSSSYSNKFVQRKKLNLSWSNVREFKNFFELYFDYMCIIFNRWFNWTLLKCRNLIGWV